MKRFVLCLLGLAFTFSLQATLLTPSGLVYTHQDPQIRFSYFNTYDVPPDVEDPCPVALDYLPRSSTTFVYAMLGFENLLFDVEEKTYDLTFKFYLESGKLMGERTSKFTVKKDWSSAWFFDSWGWRRANQWPLGKHKVEVWINNTLFAVRDFIITDN